MNTDPKPEHAVRCANCTNWAQLAPIAVSGYCPVFNKQTTADHGSQCTAFSLRRAPSTPPASQSEGLRLDAPCHICGKPKTQPGEPWCSGGHVRDPAADAPEPPWEAAARYIQRALPFELSGDKLSLTIRQTCEQHAAALAQERDDLLEVLRIERSTPSERLLEALTDVVRLTDERDQAIAERDVSGLECETLRSTVARLTAERDRYRDALLGVANHVYITGQSCWCNAWEDNPEHYRPDQHHACCTVALALSAPKEGQ